MQFNKKLLPLMLVPLFLLYFFISCSKSSNTQQPAVSGKIIAVASGITGQTGNVYSVAAFDYDWSPGATIPAVATILTAIASDPFSSSEYLHPTNGSSNDSMTFTPKTYSVVFFISPPTSSLTYYAKVRIAVNGDVTATAPTWASWVHL